MPKKPTRNLVERRGDGHLVIHPMRIPYVFKLVSSISIPAGRWADCSDPRDKLPRIRISRSAKGKRRLQKIIHETLHSANWWLDEEWIDKTAKLLCELLWELGYRGDPKAALELIEFE